MQKKEEIKLPDIVDESSRNSSTQRIPSVLRLKMPGPKAYFDRISAMYAPNKGINTKEMMNEVVHTYCGFKPETLRDLDEHLEYNPQSPE